MSGEERTELEEFVSSGTHSARAVTRARILLTADAGAPDRAIADAIDCSENTPYTVRKLYTERALDAVDRKQPDRTYDRRLDGEGEARLIALACSEPPEGRSSWTLRLLADELVALEEIEIESIFHENGPPNAQQNDLQPHRSKQWVIPPEADTEFVYHLGGILLTLYPPSIVI